MIGTTLAHFKITAKLGEGGMGEVYRAEDTKLGRDVAIKVLPEAVAEDPERLARFEREAKVLAALDHANIAAIYGLEEAGQHGEGEGTVRFLVMQLVEGEDLSVRIARGALAFNEAIAIALQIANALEAAHEKGIVHRDLKPANVMLGPDDSVKVLDFGLAKALEEEGGEGSAPGLTQSPTLTAQMTQVGVLLGTAGYMSPEQARGQEADKRSDIWAFGVVLMEMLTGQTVYRGDTISDTLASVLAREPEWEDLPEDTPAFLRRLLDRCLEKDLRSRLRDIGEARIALESPAPDPVPIAETPDGEAVVAAPVAEPSRLPWVVAAAAILAAAALGFLMLNEPEPSGRLPVARMTTQLPEGHEPWLAWGDNLAFSPDGRSIAYVIRTGEGSQLFVRDLDSLEAREITDAADARQLFFSPDGKWIGFFTNTELKKVAATGGASFTLAKASTSRGGSWGADDTIYFAPTVDTEIFRIPASGGEPVAVTVKGDGIRSHRWPQLLLDGRHLLFTAQPTGSNFDDATIELLDLETGEVSVLHRGGSTGRLLPTGHLVFVREGTLFAAPFDLASKRLTAQPGPVATGLYFDPSSGAMHLTASVDGTVLYVTGQSAAYEVTPYLARLDGSEAVLTPEVRNYRSPRFSPDGSSIAFDFDSDGGERDIWIYDLARKVFSRMTFHEQNDRFPVWFPEGDRIAFLGSRDAKRSVWVRAADGSGADEMLLESTVGGGLIPSSFSPDGQYLALDIWSETDDSWDLGILDTESREMSVYLDTEFQERRSSFSPDGRWIAYQSDESGRFEIYVRPFPDTGGRWQVSVAGGWYPRWSPVEDGILFRSEAGIERTQVKSDGEALQISRPEVVIEGDQDKIAWHPFFPMFDISPDGQTIVLFREVKGEEAAPPQVQAVFNWFDELNELAPIEN